MAPRRQTLTEGDTYRYTAEEPFGNDAGAIMPGTVVTVRETVDAATPGAGNSNEDCVVVEFDAPALVRGENGVELGTSRRAVSFGLDDFADRFTKES
jgi:hypothetical protein